MFAAAPTRDRSRGRSLPLKRRGAQAQLLSRFEVEGKGEDARICLGMVTGTHGVRGLVRIKSFTAEPEAIAAYGPLVDESGARRFEIGLVGAHKSALLARIRGVEDRNAAESLKGLRLYVRRAALPPTEENEFYEADLVGLAALREDGSRLGSIGAVYDFGAGASLEIKDDAGASVVVPFTRAAVPVVDLAAKRIIVVPPVGLLDELEREDSGEE